MPQPGYDVAYYWITRPAGFLAAGLRKKGVPRALGFPLALAGAPLVWTEGRLRGRGRGAPATRHVQLRVLSVDDVDDHFDELWERKVAEGPKLLAERTSETLRWHFSRPVASPPFFVAAFDGDRLEGYATVIRQDSSQLGLRRARIADLLVAGDDASTIRELLGASIREAGARGADMVELVGFPAAVRAVAKELRPFELSGPAWPYHFRATDRGLQRELESAELWHASLFDGDGSL
jgi:hypothetical protein